MPTCEQRQKGGRIHGFMRMMNAGSRSISNDKSPTKKQTLTVLFQLPVVLEIAFDTLHLPGYRILRKDLLKIRCQNDHDIDQELGHRDLQMYTGLNHVSI